MSKIKILGYIRVPNNEDNRESNNSREHQRQAIEKYVAEKFYGCEYELDICEDVCSGRSPFSKRDGYMQILPSMLSGEYDVLVLKNISRFSRSPACCVDELARLAAVGVKVSFIDENVHLRGDGLTYHLHT